MRRRSGARDTVAGARGQTSTQPAKLGYSVSSVLREIDDDIYVVVDCSGRRETYIKMSPYKVSARKAAVVATTVKLRNGSRLLFFLLLPSTFSRLLSLLSSLTIAHRDAFAHSRSHELFLHIERVESRYIERV